MISKCSLTAPSVETDPSIVILQFYSLVSKVNAPSFTLTVFSNGRDYSLLYHYRGPTGRRFLGTTTTPGS